jgi:hypothetical protein
MFRRGPGRRSSSSPRSSSPRFGAHGQLDHAEMLHRRALAIRERGLPDTQSDLLRSLRALEGTLRNQTSRLDDAMNECLMGQEAAPMAHQSPRYRERQASELRRGFPHSGAPGSSDGLQKA